MADSAAVGTGPDAVELAGLSILRRRAEEDEQEPFETGIRLSKAGYRTVLPFVARVQRDSPADQAGVQKDDLILAVNGKNIKDADEYEERMKDREPDEAVTLVIRRGRRILTVELPVPSGAAREGAAIEGGG